MSSSEFPQKSEQPLDLIGRLGRYAPLYQQWARLQDPSGQPFSETHSPAYMSLEAWLRDIGTTNQLKRYGPLPHYADLGAPFALSAEQVGRLVQRLRREGVLPVRHPRSDAGKPQWSKRDVKTLWWIGQQRAVRYDQLQYKLARTSDGEPQNPDLLSMTRTTQIIKRWQTAHLAEYRKVYVKQPGWIWLTRKGLNFVGLEYRPGAPAESSLTHLYYINEVRLLWENALEDREGSFTWTSERTLQHAREEMRQRDRELSHTPDAILTIDGVPVDIEVELTRKPQREIERIMFGSTGATHSTNALYYYTSRQAHTTVHAAWNAVEKAKGRGTRPWIKVEPLDDVCERPG